MLQKVASAAVSLPLVVAILAGCLEDTSKKDYHAAGEAGNFALGYAYDGKGVLGFEGWVTIHANDASNTGEVIVVGRLNNQEWHITFDRFAQQGADKPFQNGGIATNLMEHGDTKNGDASIPKVHADSAGWGDAAVTVAGKPLPDALTGEARWVAHYMVITTGIRDDVTKGIWNAAKTGPYDPSKGADGLATEGDNEVHLILRSHATAPPAPTAVDNESGPVNRPGTQASFKYSNPLQNSEFDANVSMTGTIPPATTLTFTFKDPTGKPVKTVQLRQDVGAPPVPPPPQRVQFPMNATGTYTCDVSGNAIGAEFAVTGQITPPSNVIMSFWWEDVLFGDAAEQFELMQTDETGDHTHPADMPTPTVPTGPSTPAPPTTTRA